jgi:hypothetical protein
MEHFNHIRLSFLVFSTKEWWDLVKLLEGKFQFFLMRLNFFKFFLKKFQLLGPTKVLISIIFKTFKLLSKSRLKYQHCLIENINTIAVSNAFPNIIQSNYMYVNKIYKMSFLQQTMFLAHLTQRVRWAIVTTEHPSSVVRPSVNFSHFNQLLW